ncbi:hypothetical protein E5673_14375 [Sphingomonas sp. PAMC26645]|uniref:hypothetical protein n=1 Tax=Sphingomonas sp. PAMC26645 TaxID=2565555 RepID=UPI00109E1433|nr:hypothetical protein [Sphingomonas sp. PAMC26645]QCB43264.1 hypothetical protein E5673_14375 [Sphingomonas sp. PAMC26645]
MNAMIQSAYEGPVSFTRVVDAYEDPLDQDSPFDRPVPATRRALTRLALVAAETGARFQRDGLGADPMAWMLSPRRVFNGGTAIDAVLGREDFMRALLLHSLSIGLDADPEFIDELVSETEDPEEVTSGEGGGWFGHPREDDVPKRAHRPEGLKPRTHPRGDSGSNRVRPHGATPDDATETGDQPDEGEGRRLYTATLTFEDGHTTLQVFNASVCASPSEAFTRLASRYGVYVAFQAELHAGYDPTSAFAEAFVSPAMDEMLQLVDDDPSGALGDGLDLNLEQRFAA